MEIQDLMSLPSGVQFALVGDNASGKSRLVETLVRRFPTRVCHISFRDSYGDVDSAYYLQLRWNQQVIDEETPTAGEVLRKAYEMAESRSQWSAPEVRERDARLRAALRDRLYAMFGLDSLLDKYVISLSSGESRTVQLTRALLSLPEVLVLDNPFIGLDSETRDSLSGLLTTLVHETGIRIIPVLSRYDVMPAFLTPVLPVTDGQMRGLLPVGTWMAEAGAAPACDEEIRRAILSLPSKDLSAMTFYPQAPGSEIVRCNHVSIRYGERTILRDFNWTVREGERWALSGANGAGKSTLLSLICADNPQSYACDIELFGHKRGSGESIWDIKRHIGYVSPEMHRAYLKNIPALDIVASGLFDTVGLFMHADAAQLEVCRFWMRVFGIGDLAERNYMQLSSGEQRLCLLARAFVKDPELLILDEPLHGLDERNCIRVRAIVDSFVRRPHKTLMMVTHFPAELPPCIDHHLTLLKNR